MLLIFFNQCSVTNPVHGLPLTRHQRSLAHHMDSCTTPTVALNLRLQFPSSIGLTIHTADCTDHTTYKPWTLCRVLYCMYPSDSFSTEPTQLFYSCLVCFSCFDICPCYLDYLSALSLCLALLDIVRRSQTYACPRITLCLAIYI